MEKIIEALQMASTELKHLYKKLEIDQSNVLRAVDDAIIEAKEIQVGNAVYYPPMKEKDSMEK